MPRVPLFLAAILTCSLFSLACKEPEAPKRGASNSPKANNTKAQNKPDNKINNAKPQSDSNEKQDVVTNGSETAGSKFLKNGEKLAKACLRTMFNQNQSCIEYYNEKSLNSNFCSPLNQDVKAEIASSCPSENIDFGCMFKDNKNTVSGISWYYKMDAGSINPKSACSGGTVLNSPETL